MNARVVAAVALRLIGACLFLRALYGTAVLLWFLKVTSSPGTHFRWFNGTVGSADLHLHDTYYVIAHRPIAILASLIAGIVLLVATKPLARLITWKLDKLQ